MRRLQALPDAPRYLIDDMVEDVLERLAFLRHEPVRALVVGDWTGALARSLALRGCNVIESSPENDLDEESPLPLGDFDLIVSLGTLDTVNDLPGALIHQRNALAQGGLMLASFPGAGSLPALRAALAVADGDRPASRLHPMVDVRAGGQLLQRAGFADPVVDSRAINVRFSSFDALVADLRAQGLGNVLADAGPTQGKSWYRRAVAAFEGLETIEVLTLSGWRK